MKGRLQFHLISQYKAVLTPPQSRRFASFKTSENFAKRLECGAFTAALFCG
jgi:hypothetical protein